MHDSDPSGIRATSLRRDDIGSSNDWMILVLDTLHGSPHVARIQGQPRRDPHGCQCAQRRRRHLQLWMGCLLGCRHHNRRRGMVGRDPHPPLHPAVRSGRWPGPPPSRGRGRLPALPRASAGAAKRHVTNARPIRNARGRGVDFPTPENRSASTSAPPRGCEGPGPDRSCRDRRAWGGWPRRWPGTSRRYRSAPSRSSRGCRPT